MTPAETAQPQVFTRALHALREARLRTEVRLTEIPAPARIAPWAVALTGDVLTPPTLGGSDAEETSGRFVLLHDPHGQEAWEGQFRLVTLVRATLDPEVVADPMLSDAAWSWVEEALQEVPGGAVALGGTVTRVHSQSFAALAERPAEVEVEIRASWSPGNAHPDAAADLAGEHLAAWARVLCTAAGLPPLPAGVTALGRRL